MDGWRKLRDVVSSTSGHTAEPELNPVSVTRLWTIEGRKDVWFLSPQTVSAQIDATSDNTRRMNK